MFSMVIREKTIKQTTCPACGKTLLVGECQHLLCPICCEVMPDLYEILDNLDERQMYHQDEEIYL